ncbi:PEP-CTERM sorting domain-containing protein [Gloeothece verrucosa]|uniref:Uncharacterized protein n=1 Tax=Gloeothece verrucosa (strain PCC 7822) TaxID=497965 RepID=E0U792_GLOV7|nr:PEP-CTERM sorting domain-containing protein [Gloeothece verrucosa]ADN12479.1 protein of unknown function DUF1555 [Gloeothece verrucosa PCC 7822]
MTSSHFKLFHFLPATALFLGITAIFLHQEIARAAFTTSAPAQATGLNGWKYDPLFTVGDTVNGYTPVGILDGIGAVDGTTIGLNSNLVRVLVNHELSAGTGASYKVNNGGLTINGGARISYFDIDKTTRQIVNAGLAYNAIYDRNYNLITNTSQFKDGILSSRTSLDRFCSGSAFGRYSFGNGIGFEDTIYFAGEETSNGTQWALDVAGGNLWAVPQMGRGAWENWTELNTGRTDVVALLGGDDTTGAPLYLYVGKKGGAGDGSFLDRNGLKQGKLYAWKSNTGALDPSQFNGTGNSLNGQWVELANQGSGTGYVNGYASANTLRTQADNQGGFSFARNEDLTTNPNNGTQAAFNATGNSLYPSDLWGDTYILDNQLVFDINGQLDTNASTANLNILYDGDDAGKGQFPGPDYGLRSPDNLDWADDGLIYVQEDPAVSGFGATSQQQPSIWQINPTTGKLTRVAQLTNPDPATLAEWESSGVLDVTHLFDTKPGEKVLIFDIQAHTLKGGNIATYNLVEGGQLGLLTTAVPEPLTLLGAGCAMGFGAFFKRKLKAK